MSTSQRNVIVVLHGCNFVGVLNHAIKAPGNTYEKLRIDYKAFLQYLARGRNIIGAYYVSQYDPQIHQNRPKSDQERNNKFFTQLSKFGWTPLQTTYDIMYSDTSNTLTTLWESIISPYYKDGNLTLDINNTDVVVVTGSSTWSNILYAFKDIGFNVDLAFVPKATNKQLAYKNNFIDISSFLISQYSARG